VDRCFRRHRLERESPEVQARSLPALGIRVPRPAGHSTYSASRAVLRDES
jgi:hypothetical protein